MNEEEARKWLELNACDEIASHIDSGRKMAEWLEELKKEQKEIEALKEGYVDAMTHAKMTGANEAMKRLAKRAKKDVEIMRLAPTFWLYHAIEEVLVEMQIEEVKSAINEKEQ